MSNKIYTVGIIGLGYVGHSLFQAIQKKNISIVGYDISKKKINELKKKFKYKNISAHLSFAIIAFSFYAHIASWLPSFQRE